MKTKEEIQAFVDKRSVNTCLGSYIMGFCVGKGVDIENLSHSMSESREPLTAKEFIEWFELDSDKAIGQENAYLYTDECTELDEKILKSLAEGWERLTKIHERIRKRERAETEKMQENKYCPYSNMRPGMTMMQLQNENCAIKRENRQLNDALNAGVKSMRPSFWSLYLSDGLLSTDGVKIERLQKEIEELEEKLAETEKSFSRADTAAARYREFLAAALSTKSTRTYKELKNHPAFDKYLHNMSRIEFLELRRIMRKK